VNEFPNTPFRWQPPPAVPQAAVEALERSLGIPRGLCRILAARGMADEQAARRFLRPAFDQLHPPSALPDMAKAVERLEIALQRGESILVHGDYDVDGMSGAALLVRALEDLGGRVDGFVPHRTRDGYDLGSAGLQRARERKASLIVTADCGTTALEAVREAATAGIDVIVTDHHRTGASLPEAVAVVNPTRADSVYPFDGLAGVGVAYKLVAQLYADKGFPEEHVNQHLDLVALGTVADQAPLVDENRVLVRLGLRALQRSRKFGLQALLWTTGLLEEEGVRASDIAFRLGPRLNAVGRIGSASDGLRLLLTEDREEAVELAGRLGEENTRRQAADRRLVREALEELRDEYSPDRDRVVVLSSDVWHPGLLGIAASRIARMLHRPTALITFEGEVGRGSARSVKGFNLVRALEACASTLERFGGHEMAAGLSVHRSRLGEFVECFRAHAQQELSDECLVPELRLDLEMSLEELTPRFARYVEYFGPFGVGNSRPRLLVRGVRLDRIARMGEDGRHLRLRLEAGEAGEESGLAAVAFGMGERFDELRAGGTWDVVFEVHRDSWRGRTRTRAHLLDLRPTEQPASRADGRGAAAAANAG
jgi:single-stranded-DNA-specific exonuclease